MNHIEIIDDKAMITGRNIKVRMVAGMYIKVGATVEAIMEQYDLSYAEVHAALAYYYDNQDAFEREHQAVQPLIEEAQQDTAKRLESMRRKAKELRG